ncbi:probable inactive shikimate kinase like 1, chloroplastic isoform X2 [Prosopis cineraria]|uniref:probable inactive shikimate kinase like 1, chloroplastic isoform X2 n=1 Tax=Prosopis cineraria TaxID=364024 RepID=UPI00240F989C|nr:probable inactive shikimate kinase like 1, chloroplastic isoform X2 [Prosopis cineraria]
MEKAIPRSLATSPPSQSGNPFPQFRLLTSSTLPNYKSLRISPPPHSPLRRRLPVYCSIPDSKPSNSTTNVAVKDTSLAVKKKAADVSPELKGTSIFLLGMKSSIKMNMGKLLADTLRYYYFDSDNLVEEASGGASAVQSSRLSDENGFRESETEVLKQLSSMGRLVVCAGNGAVQSSTNLAFLRHGITLWIDVPLDMVAGDLFNNQSEFSSFEVSSSGSHEELMSQLAALYDKYRDGYATADAVVSLQKVASGLGYEDLGDVTEEEMTLEVLRELEKLTRTKKMLEEAARPF